MEKDQTLKSIELSRFQSHDNTTLEFVLGINAIIGKSKEGKTSVLRAINAIINNKPSGLTYNSYWNRTDKKEPIEDHYSKMIFDDLTIQRTKSKKSNNYILNGDVLEADKTWSRGAPPEEVTQALRITEVNFQKQFDRPFLLDESSAEIGRFFNKIVNLDLSDRILAKAEQDRKNIASDIKNLDIDIKDSKEKLTKFEWIEKAEKIITDIDEINTNVEEKQAVRDDICLKQQSILSYEKELKEINKIPFEKAENLINDIKEFDQYIEGREKEWEDINALLLKLDECESELKNIDAIPFDKIYELLDKIQKIDDVIKELRKEEINIATLQDNLEENKIKYGEIRQEIRTIEKQLPRVCPTCKRRF